MRKTVCVIMCLFFLNEIYCQTINERQFEITLNTRNSPDIVEMCYISFFCDSLYKIELSNDWKDMIVVFELSKGNYYVKNDTILLVDSFFNFKQLLINGTNGLLVASSFPFLSNKEFVPATNYYYSHPDSYESGVSTLMLKQEREEYNTNNCRLIEFKTGRYKCDRLHMILNISDNYEYTLTYYDIIVSKGTLSRSLIEIAFNDRCLNYSFYCLVAENDLISRLVIGDVIGCSFFYEENNSVKEKASLKNLLLRLYKIIRINH